MRAHRLLLVLGLALALTACSDSKTAAPIPSLTTNPPTTTAAPTTEPTTASPSPTETPSVPDSPAPLGQPVCKGSALTVTDADTLTDPSSVREVYSVRTTGPDCQLEGYPTVTFPRAVTVSHSGFGVPASKADPVTLSRSTSVSFEIGSARNGSCTTLATITVTLPHTSPGHRVATSLKVCGNAVAISPVLRRGDID
ncbi:MAG: hypothetical protein JWM40_2561 [Frankiales bacterium]|nr:hypothetical protein [Frankiales bacterium]